MSDFHTIKYRLIGAAIIVCALVLSWWLFLDHDVRRYQDIRDNQPEPLVIERFDIAKPVAPQRPPAEPQDESAAGNNKDVEPEAKVPAKPAAEPSTPYAAVDDDGLPQAWVLQVASFRQSDNARQLQQQLLAAGMPAYVKKFRLDSGDSYRVLVGPKLSQQRARQLLEKVKKEFQLEGMLVRYKPGYEE